MVPNQKPTQRRLVEPQTAVDEYLLEDKSIEAEKFAIRKKLGMPSSEIELSAKSFYGNLKQKLYRAGLEIEPTTFISTTLHITLFLLVFGTFIVGVVTILNKFPLITIIAYLLVWSILGFIFLYSLVVVVARLYLEYLIFKRKIAVERVLPEFLRLVATNYRSGLSLDEALTKSNRDRFGVLSKEIAIVSKTAKVKGDLAKALEIFGKKYESKILERAMNNLSVSIRTGSNVSSLLEEIANNITKMRTMRASMAANVKNYIIFIIVAAVIIAPLMFSMSYHMNKTIVKVKANIADQRDISSQNNLLGSVSSEGGILPDDFDVFAIFMLITNSFISAFVISMIKYGNYQQGFKRIPVFLGISIFLYVIGKELLSYIVVFV